MTKGGGGVKNLKKLMTSFMNGPLGIYYFENMSEIYAFDRYFGKLEH